MDPIASLSRLERNLLRISKQHGPKPFVAAVTAISVALSVAITSLLMLVTGSPGDDVAIGVTLAFVVPAIVAPAAASMLARLLQALDAAAGELHQLARIDSLTGVLNRRAFSGGAETVVDLVGDRRLLVAMVDVDDFKDVNDRHGHATGDRVLVALAERLTGAVGSRGVVGRFGGDEFVLCVAVDVTDIAEVEDTLYAACDLADVAPGVAASIGTHVAELGESLAEAMAHADHALYDHKRVDDKGVRWRDGRRSEGWNVNEMSGIGVMQPSGE